MVISHFCRDSKIESALWSGLHFFPGELLRGSSLGIARPELSVFSSFFIPITKWNFLGDSGGLSAGRIGFALDFLPADGYFPLHGAYPLVIVISY